jgi:hypothetical protein
MGEVRKLGGVRDSLVCATRLYNTLALMHVHFQRNCTKEHFHGTSWCHRRLFGAQQVYESLPLASADRCLQQLQIQSNIPTINEHSNEYNVRMYDPNSWGLYNLGAN